MRCGVDLPGLPTAQSVFSPWLHEKPQPAELSLLLLHLLEMKPTCSKLGAHSARDREHRRHFPCCRGQRLSVTADVQTTRDTEVMSTSTHLRLQNWQFLWLRESSQSANCLPLIIRTQALSTEPTYKSQVWWFKWSQDIIMYGLFITLSNQTSEPQMPRKTLVFKKNWRSIGETLVSGLCQQSTPTLSH